MAQPAAAKPEQSDFLQMRVRSRPDLVVSRQQNAEGTVYLIKDPVGLTYFRFHRQEFRLLQLLDGKRTLAEVIEQFDREMAPDTLTEDELKQVINRMTSSSLIMLEDQKTGSRLLELAERKKRMKLIAKFTNPLYIKFKAFDPDPFLNWLYPKVRWIFSSQGMLLQLVLLLTAVSLVLTRLDQLLGSDEQSNLQAYINPQSLLWFWCALGITKILHEFGHALMCKHFGGECHEMGFLLMVMTPCLYCETSDAWMMPNKWHRISIALGGMYFESLVASVAAITWTLTADGFVHHLCFWLMLIGSVETVLINANPLMRYDGYFVMMDFLEVPNLRQRANRWLKTYVMQLLYGSRKNQGADSLQGGFGFALYAVAAYCYSWLVLFTMAWFLYTFLRPYKMSAVGHVLLLSLVVSMLLQPVMWLIRLATVRTPGKTTMFRLRPILVTALLIAGLVGVLAVPLPLYTYSVLTVEPVEARPLVATIPGRVAEVLRRPGARVEAGTPIVQLANEDVQTAIDQLLIQCDTARNQIRTALAKGDPAAERLASTSLAEYEKQLAAERERQAQLTLAAAQPGWIVPPPEHAAPPTGTAQATPPLAGWSGTPLDEKNRDAWLDGGTPVCLIAPDARREAVMIVEQESIEFVRVGLPVRLKFDALPAEMIHGKVVEVSAVETRDAPTQLLNVAGSELPTQTQGPNAGHLNRPHYRVRVELTPPAENADAWWNRLNYGGRGRGWVVCEWESLAKRLYRSTLRLLQT